MTGEPEAAGDVLTGAIVGRTIDGPAGGSAAEHDKNGAHAACLNCGSKLNGAFCSACGQSAHLHRSLSSIGHEILHAVFHFEGKIWRTLPELMFRPGRLTRRYIDGERAKFVSPMALFLFTVFLMFAVFSATGFLNPADFDPDAVPIASSWKSGNEAALQQTNDEIAELRMKLEDSALPPDERVRITTEIADLESAAAVMKALAKGDWAGVVALDEERGQREREQVQISAESNSRQWPPPGSRLDLAIKQAQDNPKLLLYKVKTNAYKFSWALIPLSVPFLWVLFFWRRDVHLYDHAVFTTYSITFMMLFLIVLSVAVAAGLHAAIWGTALALVPPLHMYKQLRGTYGLSRFGAFVRLILLLIVTSIVVTIFTLLLFVVGVID